MKLGLYSITYLGIWYRGRALSMPEVVERAVSLGFDGIEIDGKRPHGNPLDWDDDERRRFRELCASRGLDIVGVASNNDFSSPLPFQRRVRPGAGWDAAATPPGLGGVRELSDLHSRPEGYRV